MQREDAEICLDQSRADLFGFRDENQQCDPMFLAIESLTSADLLFERQNATTIQAGTKHLQAARAEHAWGRSDTFV